MNGKKAKMIKRMAKEAPVANDPVCYVVGNKQGTVELDSACTRYLAQKFKKELKQDKKFFERANSLPQY